MLAEAVTGERPSPESLRVAVLVICPAGALLETVTGTVIEPIVGFVNPLLGGVNVQVTTSLLAEQVDDPKLDPLTVGMPLRVR